MAEHMTAYIGSSCQTGMKHFEKLQLQPTYWNFTDFYVVWQLQPLAAPLHFVVLTDLDRNLFFKHISYVFAA